METVALGFVKNNPWVQIDRAKRVMLKETEKTSKFTFNGGSNEFNRNNVFSEDAEFSSKSNGDDENRMSNFSDATFDEELEYGPGFVEKLKNRYLQLVASTAAADAVEISSTAISSNSSRNKHKVYGRRTASCDDLMNDGPISPQRKMSGPQKSQSTLTVFKPKTLVPTTQSVSIEPPPIVPSVPIPSSTVHPSFSQNSISENNTQSISNVKPPVVVNVKQKSSLPVRSTSVQEMKTEIKRESFDNDEEIPEFVKKSKNLKHIDKPIEVAVASVLPPEPRPTVSSVYADKSRPTASNVYAEENKSQKKETVSKIEPETVEMIEEVFNSSTDKAPVENKAEDFVDFSKTNRYHNPLSNEEEIKSFLNSNFDEYGPITGSKTTRILNETFSNSIETNLPMEQDFEESPNKNRNLKPVLDKEQRIPSPVPSLSEMKELLQKFQVQRKQREDETKIESEPIKNSSTPIKNGENLLNFDMYDGLEQNFIADEPPVKLTVSPQRMSLSSQFKRQNQQEIVETNGTPPIERNGNSMDYAPTSLMDLDISSQPSTAHVLQPMAMPEPEKVDFNGSMTKNGFYTVATYNNPVSTVGRVGSRAVNGYGVINGDDIGDDDDDEDIDALLNDDNAVDDGRNFEFVGAYVKLEKSSIASSSHKLKAAVEFKTDSPRAYAYVEELDAQEAGGWQQGTELNYKEYKEMCDRMKQDKFKRSFLPSNQDNVHVASSSNSVENDRIANSGHLANFTPTHLRSADYNLGSTITETSSLPTVISDQVEEIIADSNVDDDQNGSFYADNNDDLLF